MLENCGTNSSNPPLSSGESSNYRFSCGGARFWRAVKTAAPARGVQGGRHCEREIVERTDGVPLFVEELTKAVVETGADRSSVSISAVPPSSLAVPATLHASLLGRLDRLGPAAKNVAQVGAAIGRVLGAACAPKPAEQAESTGTRVKPMPQRAPSTIRSRHSQSSFSIARTCER